MKQEFPLPCSADMNQWFAQQAAKNNRRNQMAQRIKAGKKFVRYTKVDTARLAALRQEIMVGTEISSEYEDDDTEMMLEYLYDVFCELKPGESLLVERSQTPEETE